MPPTIPGRGGPSSARRYQPPVPGAGGKGKAKAHPLMGIKRHRKVTKDTIMSITKGDIRRLARRGGVKRISGVIYNDVRDALKARLAQILQDCVAFVEYRQAKTVTVSDVIFALKRIGRPIYGFDPETYVERKVKQARAAADK